ncbi:hypothetical protein CA264_11100 [Pontibacter actiniarum]|uniref:Uncharacterized protein n=2 Tax=Pontibacter actiniarum TaxID=323450 RepID=A0A1X9YSS7_9BACT|nr:hypothetical protein CA264_11100 [Pontibacter actiniarum]
MVLLIAFCAVGMFSYTQVQCLEYQQGVDAPLLVSLLTICLLLYACYFFIRFYAKSTPKVVITPEQVRIGKDVFKVDAIAAITIFGNSENAYKRTMNRQPEVSTMLLHDGRRFDLFVEHYQNGHLLRKNLSNLEKYLRQELHQFTLATATKTTPASAYMSDNYTKYTGSPFGSFIFYLYTTAMLVCLLPLFLISLPLPVQLLALGICGFLYLLAAFQSHYFLLSDNFLVVKSLFLPWNRKKFQLQDILSAEVQTSLRQETSLKLITSDFKLYRFQSGLLSHNSFDSLERDIKLKRLHASVPTAQSSIETAS